MRWPVVVPAPRYIEPNATYAICRRVEGRRFLLRPDDELTALFVYLLALYAAKFGVTVHMATVMSTHFHLVVTVPHGNVSEFMHALDTHLACAIQVLRRYAVGVVWAPGQLTIVQLHTAEAVAHQIAYAMVNPTAAGLVWRPAQWPGLNPTLEELGRRTLSAGKPEFYFTGKKWAPAGAVKLELPMQWFEDEEEAREAIAQELAAQLADARAEIRARGWKVMGPTRARNVSPYRRAKTSEARGTLRPHVAAGPGQTEARIAAIEQLVEFRRKHREAKRRWCAGDRDVVFPRGTYWMVKHHGARVEPFP